MTNSELTARFWDSAWGEVEDYDFAQDIEELAGFSIGDDVICIVDEAQDPTNPSSVYLYYTVAGSCVNRVARYTLSGSTLSSPITSPWTIAMWSFPSRLFQKAMILNRPKRVGRSATASTLTQM